MLSKKDRTLVLTVDGVSNTDSTKFVGNSANTGKAPHWFGGIPGKQPLNYSLTH